MINRLVAENNIKASIRGQINFSVSKKLIAFPTEHSLKIKSLHRETKDIDIPISSPPLQYSISNSHPWLLLLTHNHLLQIYLVQYISGITEGSFKKIAILHNVQQYTQNRWGLFLASTNKTIKNLSFKELAQKTQQNLNIDSTSLKSLSGVEGQFKLMSQMHTDRLILSKYGEEGVVSEVFDRMGKELKYERQATVGYLKDTLALYKGRYVFQRKGDKEVQIIDMDESKVVGKFANEGTIRHCQIQQNLLLIITNKENIDCFNFLVLNPQPSSNHPLITNRSTYEKSKGDAYKIYNLLSAQASQFLQKKKNSDISDSLIEAVAENTSSLLYIFNKSKDKIEIIKLDHSKLLKSPFGEERMSQVIYSKQSEDTLSPLKKEENTEIERARVHSSIELKNGEKTMQEMQKKFVQNLIDIKLKKVMVKFDELQRRVIQLEKVIYGINTKIQQNLEKINRKEIKLKVQQLFDSLTPQFEKYFSQIFKQVSGVFEQGVTYYNLKLAKEAEFHKDAITQIVNETFKFTEEVVDISKKEQEVSEKTDEALKKILESKKKWNRDVQEFQNRTREVPSPVVKLAGSGESGKAQGKVFVRADLNYPASKRQT